MRVLVAILGTGLASLSAAAESIDTNAWETGLAEAEQCIEESKPDARQAALCYPLKELGCVGAGDFDACMRERIHELAGLLPLYNKHADARELAAHYDPARCESMYAKTTNLERDGFLLSCRFTTLMSQVIAGHIASVWDEKPSGD